MDTVWAAPGVLFIAGSDLYRSEDGGNSWQALDDPAYYASKGPLAFSPNFTHDGFIVLGLGYGFNALLLSSDGGYSWRSPAQQVIGPITSIAISPSFPAHPVIYVATSAYTGEYLLRSTDGGEHWENVTPPGGVPVRRVLLSPDLAVDRTLFLYMQNGTILRSEDDGETWVSASGGLGVVASVAISPDFPNDATLYAAIYDDGLYESTDRGQSWQIIYPFAPGETLTALTAAPDFATSRRLFAVRTSGGEALARSTDAGRTWTTILAALPYSYAVSPTYTQDRTLYVRTRESLMASTDGGDTWQSRARNYGGSEYRYERLVVSPSLDDGGVIFAAPASGKDDPVLRSTDAGRTWTALSFPAPGQVVLALSPAFASDHTVLAAVGSELLISNDLGDHWEVLGSTPMSPTDILRPSPGYPGDQTLFVADYWNGVYRSTDNGQTWELLTASIGPYVTDLEVSPGYPDDQTLFVSIYNDNLYRSEDGGSHWTHLTSPTFSPNLNIEISPDYPTDHTVFVNNNGGSNGGAFRSTDRGNTWVDITGSVLGHFLPVAAVSPHFAQDHTVIIGRESGPLYISEEAGDSWFPLAGIPAVGAYGRDYGLALSTLGGRLCPVASAPDGVYVYRWPRLRPIAPVLAAIEPGSVVPVIRQRALAADIRAMAPWEIRGSTDWLTVAPMTGTLPAGLTLTLNPAGVKETVRTELLVDVYWSYRQTEAITVPVTLALISNRILLPLVFNAGP
ncbi:MAG: WD40/YVTN/BNR-like repeat-containing protein [Chloroflexia bacterium]